MHEIALLNSFIIRTSCRGANTGIGKTLVSIGLADAARRSGVPLLYLKPAQTGFPDDSDARVVALAYGTHPVMGPHAAMLAPEVSFNHAHEEPVSRVKVMHAWSSPVSPHLAVSREGRPVSDRELLTSVSSELIAFARRLEKERSTAAGGSSQKGIALLETAGGVASPAPSGELQVSLCISSYFLARIILVSCYSRKITFGNLVKSIFALSLPS